MWGYLPSFLFLFVVFRTFIAAVFTCVFFWGVGRRKKRKTKRQCSVIFAVVVVCATFLCLFCLIFFFFSHVCVYCGSNVTVSVWSSCTNSYGVATIMASVFFFLCVWCLLAWGIVRCYLWAYCVRTDKCDCPYYYSFCFVVVVFGGKSRERLALDSTAKQEKETCSVCCSS